MTRPAIVSLDPAHLPQLETLLIENRLPADDLDEQADCFVGMFDGERLVAAAGLEDAGNYALLRSLAVRADYRGRGYADALCRYLLERARARRKSAVYLLTESAATYFEKFGFAAQARARVPREIARTRQFASLCPASAACLRLALGPGPARRT